ncbi:MAG: HD domain-containing protein [Planctomycetota bacterium]
MATKAHDGAVLWQRAAAFAAFKHRHQVRKDGRTPYISHPFRVAMTLRHEFGCDDPAVLTAAMLHDVIEDTTTDYDDLLERFGATVADLVCAVTKNAALPKAQREPQYDAQIAAADWRARIIKLADTYDNLVDAMDLPGEHDMVVDSCEKARRAIGLASVDLDQPALVRGIAKLKALITASSNRQASQERD